ncbi:MAG: PspC domain-containing protein [Bacteroidaceae bacterium]|nr:PspC domain-containing protein [Bacteroidaceae bacterium]
MKKFVRSVSDKKVAGVCAGVAKYFDLDTKIVRIIWLAAILLGGCGLLAYLILWLVMPEEK